VPCGTGIKHLVETDLLYNEFIVYDVDQVRIRYLIKVKFEFLK
jgi:poly [ADP-ribose] polymerase